MSTIWDWRFSRQKYKDLSEQQKCEFFTLISTYPCIAASHQSKTSTESSTAFHCRICDSERTVSDAVAPWHSNEADIFRGFFLEFLPKVSRSSPLRVSYLLAVRRFLYHEPEVKRLSIKSSSVGELCLHSLKAASRELRITTGLVILWLEKKYSILTCEETCLALLPPEGCGCSSTTAEFCHHSRMSEKCLRKSGYSFSRNLHLDVMSLSRVSCWIQKTEITVCLFTSIGYLRMKSWTSYFSVFWSI